MAIIATYEQQPDELLDYDIYFANSPDGTPDWLTGGDTIESVSSVEIDKTGLVVTEFLTGDRVKLWVSGGTTGITYKVTVTITTVAGRVKQIELKFKIKEV